jgi:hypothetical protein
VFCQCFASVLPAFPQRFTQRLQRISQASSGMSTQQTTGRGKSGNIRNLFAKKLSRSFTSKDDRATEDSLLTRRELANRWKVSIETLKRRERASILRPIRLDGRIVRYRMSDVVKIEQEGYGE